MKNTHKSLGFRVLQNTPLDVISLVGWLLSNSQNGSIYWRHKPGYHQSVGLHWKYVVRQTHKIWGL